MNYGWRLLIIVQETGIKTIAKKKKCKKAKWLYEEALQIAVKRREAKSKGEKERPRKASWSGSSPPWPALAKGRLQWTEKDLSPPL